MTEFEEELAGDMASMRPPEFTGGNRTGKPARYFGPGKASMRPPEFTGGNYFITVPLRVRSPSLQ